MIVVSISCITYNHAPYIRKCLDGFLMQRCDFAFEVLIHDDASTDGTTDIILEYQKQYPAVIKPLIQKENQYSKGIRGISVKFNFPRAKGKYIAMCEGDDYWVDPFKLKRQVDFLENSPDHVVSFHDASVVDDDGGVILQRWLNILQDKDYSSNDMNLIHIPTLTMMFRNNPAYLEKFPNVFNVDIFLIGLMSQYGNAHYHAFVGAHYRRHDSGIYSSSKKTTRYYNSIITRFELLKHVGKSIRVSVRARINDLYIKLLSEFLYEFRIKAFVKCNFCFLINSVRAGKLKSFIHFQIFSIKYVVKKCINKIRLPA